MSKLRSIIILTLCLVSIMSWGQRRYTISDRKERDLLKVKGFSSKDVDNKTDAFLGLHASLYDGAHHLLGFSVDGGWNTFVNNIPEVSATPGGVAVSFKALYEYQFGHFFVQTGAGVGYQRVKTPLNDLLLVNKTNTTVFYHDNMIDPFDGAKFRMKHAFSNRVDMAEQVYAQLPLNLGYYIAGNAGIGYVMIGAQFNYAFWGRTTMSATCTSSALFERYIGVFEEIDNHGFRKEVPMSVNGPQLTTKMDVLGHIEGGYEFNTFQTIREYRINRSDNTDCRLRFAAFADISLPGLRDLNSMSSPADLYNLNADPNETDPNKLADFHFFEMNHIFETNNAASKSLWIRNLTVGVRFTVLFSMQTKEHCILCDSWRR